MIYIIDNQREYSDHRIEFVEVPEDMEATFLSLLERDKATSTLETSYDRPWKIIASVVNAEWREPDAVRSAESFMQELAEAIAWRFE